MKMTSLTINGRTVSRLFIDGREVALGSTDSEALCFTAKADQSMLRLSKVGNPQDINIQTSTDGISWTPYNIGDDITLTNVGDKVYFTAVVSNYTLASSPNDYHKFVTTGEFEASGNVNSLLEEDPNIARTMGLENRDFCFYQLFADTNLTKAPELPATTLAYGCYLMMFQNCTSLTQAPELPATTVANSCYSAMFQNCTSLTQAPELPATTLIAGCYSGMFEGCSSLNYVSVGFDNWVQYATGDWLPQNTGTFNCPQALIDNIPERTTSTVPESWTMVAV